MIWDLDIRFWTFSWFLFQLCGHLDDVLSVKLVGKEDSHIAVATNTDLLKVFHKETWECQMLQGHTDIITCLDVHLNYIVSASKVWFVELIIFLVIIVLFYDMDIHTFVFFAFRLR